ncbi:MAG: hypothetical protein ACRBF0_07045 [Calditrichia bacterium]
MSLKKSLNRLDKELQFDPEYLAEGMAMDITESICQIMDQKGLNRTALATRMQTSNAYITKVLRGNANMTLLSIAKFAVALEEPVERILFGLKLQKESVDLL